MKVISLAFAIVLVSLSSVAQAEIKAKDMRKAIAATNDTGEVDEGDAGTYPFMMVAAFQGSATGISWLNSFNEAKGMPKHYCPPKKLSIAGEQYQTIFTDYLEKNPDKGDLPYEFVLIAALLSVFPCDQAQ